MDVHVGSIAIQRFIEERQPWVTMHGHIHESSQITGHWQQQFGRTQCFFRSMARSGACTGGIRPGKPLECHPPDTLTNLFFLSLRHARNHPDPRFRFPVYPVDRPKGARIECVCEIHPFNKVSRIDASVKGVILSGALLQCADPEAPVPDLDHIRGKVPVLGVCYGAQFMAHHDGGEVTLPKPRICRANLTSSKLPIRCSKI